MPCVECFLEINVGSEQTSTKLLTTHSKHEDTVCCGFAWSESSLLQSSEHKRFPIRLERIRASTLPNKLSSAITQRLLQS